MKRQSVYAIFIWHGFFLALTLSMINFGTVLPALVDELTPSRTVFGLLYSILLAGPYLFNVVFGHFLSTFQYRKPEKPQTRGTGPARGRPGGPHRQRAEVPHRSRSFHPKRDAEKAPLGQEKLKDSFYTSP